MVLEVSVEQWMRRASWCRGWWGQWGLREQPQLTCKTSTVCLSTTLTLGLFDHREVLVWCLRHQRHVTVHRRILESQKMDEGEDRAKYSSGEAAGITSRLMLADTFGKPVSFKKNSSKRSSAKFCLVSGQGKSFGVCGRHFQTTYIALSITVFTCNNVLPSFSNGQARLGQMATHLLSNGVPEAFCPLWEGRVWHKGWPCLGRPAIILRNPEQHNTKFRRPSLQQGKLH